MYFLKFRFGFCSVFEKKTRIRFVMSLVRFGSKNAVRLPRDAMQARPMSSCGVCLYVCVSVTFVNSVKSNKRIINFFTVG